MTSVGEEVAELYDERGLMMRTAGLCLKDHRAGWNREPFTAASGRHVSVYGH
jgi:hypothetical protein